MARFSLSDRLRSLKHSLAGIAYLLRHEANSQIQVIIFALAIAAGWWIGLDRIEWALLAIAIGLTWATEAYNSAIERLSDAVTTQHHPDIKLAKDIGAAAALIAIVTSITLALIIFVPHLAGR